MKVANERRKLWRHFHATTRTTTTTTVVVFVVVDVFVFNVVAAVVIAFTVVVVAIAKVFVDIFIVISIVSATTSIVGITSLDVGGRIHATTRISTGSFGLDKIVVSDGGSGIHIVIIISSGVMLLASCRR